MTQPLTEIGVCQTIAPAQNKEYCQALGCFATGVTVITGRDSQGQPRGFTANSFTSVSLDPPIVLFCVAKSNASHSAFLRTSRFAVNVLAHDQHKVSRIFASKTVDKFRFVDWRRSARGLPIITNVVAWFECRRIQTDEMGDHFVVYGEVEDFHAREHAPLGYLRGAYTPPLIEG